MLNGFDYCRVYRSKKKKKKKMFLTRSVSSPSLPKIYLLMLLGPLKSFVACRDFVWCWEGRSMTEESTLFLLKAGYSKSSMPLKLLRLLHSFLSWKLRIAAWFYCEIERIAESIKVEEISLS